MTRISLIEAYNNRDVIAWLIKHQDAIDEFRNILENINPDGDLTNIVLKTGDQIIDGRKTFIGEIVAECDIIQNGAAYETHAEQIFSHNDYIVMRDGALNGLPAGSYSGLQVKKYNGSDDVRMVVDNSGIMRVGDINDERPIMVRDEAADLTDGAVLKWDAANDKAVNEGTVGDDTHPIKFVNGVAAPTTNPLLEKNNVTNSAGITTVPNNVTTNITDRRISLETGWYIISVTAQATSPGTNAGGKMSLGLHFNTHSQEWLQTTQGIATDGTMRLNGCMFLNFGSADWVEPSFYHSSGVANLDIFFIIQAWKIY